MSEAFRPDAHRLSLVPTPIGNLRDITVRALDTLRDADVVAAEDTRRSRVLLERHGITTPLARLDAHTMAARAPALLRAHRHVAFVTDAGSPGISDPGVDLVRVALELGIQVEALPGATAFVPALVLSGLPLARFTFEGFLPRRGRERRKRLAAIASRDHPSVLYESPVRIAASLRALCEVCGADRPAALARELTKLHEEVLRGTLGELAEQAEARSLKGEVVLVIGPVSQTTGVGPDAEDVAGTGADAGATQAPGVAAAGAATDAAALAAALAADGVRGRDLRARLVAAGVPRHVAFELAVRYKHGRRR